jgi:hypothetical protein
MDATIYLIIFGMLVAAGFSGVLSLLNRIANLLESLQKDLGPLAEEARKREKEARDARMEDIIAFGDANEASSRGLTMDEYRELEAKAEAAGLTVQEYEANEAKRTEDTPHT